VLVTAKAASRWRADRRDRLAAMVDEGWIAIPAPPASPANARGAAKASRRPGRRAAPPEPGYPSTRAASPRPRCTRRSRPRRPLPGGFGAQRVAVRCDSAPRPRRSISCRGGDRIAIEIDGIHHFADSGLLSSDRRKDLLLQTQGFIVVRLLAEDVMRDVRSAVNAVCQALAYRLKERER